MLRRFLVALGLILTGLTLGGPSPIHVVEAACAAASRSTGVDNHYAVVIIDTGTKVHRTCVSFTEATISGQKALELAGARPLFKEFSGMGSFVCRLYDTGRGIDDCVGDPTYWVYSRAPAGTTELKPSELGVTQTEVHDGDVEGWKWATAGAPEYAGPETVCHRDVDAAAVSTPRPPRDRSNGSPRALAGFAAAVLAIGAIGVKVRRSRQ